MTYSIAIIGAGLAGITAARQLTETAEGQEPAASVTLFDKSRGMGGRLATRYAEAHKFDHGAQYFTARSAEFKAALAPLIKTGDVRKWAPRILTNRKLAKQVRYVGSPNMNSVGKALAASLDVVTNTRIEKLDRVKAKWHLTDDSGKVWGQYDKVIIAIPAEQAKALLPDDFADGQALAAVNMLPGFTVMLGFAGPWGGEWDAMLMDNHPVSFASVNSTKPGRDNSITSIVVQSSNKWALKRVDKDKDEVMAELLSAFQQSSGMATGVAHHKVIHRWLYANVGTPAGKPFLADESMGLYACGDWCLEGRVEAAFASGHKLGAHILKSL